MTPLRIDVVDRSAALELHRRLHGFDACVVQHSPDSWYVAVDQRGDSDAVRVSVLDILQTWVADGGTECVLRDGDRSYPLRAPAAF